MKLSTTATSTQKLFIFLFVISISLLSCHSESKTSEPDVTRDNAQEIINRGYVKQTKMISNGKDYGLNVLAVRRTANGYMLDFRFRLNDVEKAQHIMQRKIKALLTVEKNNAKLSVPVTYKLGALRQSGKNLKENKNYFMFFANPAGIVKTGDLVTIEIAGFKAEHIIVN
ncbi:MAG: hypothetical protein ACC657_07675 [Thiohalomonadales bacterium]